MASRSGLERAIRALDVDSVRAALDESPALLDGRDGRGRTWLHRVCAVEVRGRPPGAAGASVAIADDLLDRGLDLGDAAFVEGDWRATPLWFAVARGRNVILAAHLLDLGCDPNHCLWAAAFNDDHAAIDLLIEHGAAIDPVTEDETPFLGAVKTSHFASAWQLAGHGADVDVVDSKGMTALHCMLKKSSAPEHVVTLVGLGARLDIPGPDGRTAAEILSRKADAALRALAVRA